GYRFGRLGYELVEKRGLTRYQARTYMSFGSYVLPWAKHALRGRDLVRRAFDAAYRIGDLTFAAYCCTELVTNFLIVGDPLAEVQPEAENALAFVQQARFGLIVDIIIVQVGLIRTFRGLTPKFGCFNDEGFDELEFERHLASNQALMLADFWYCARKVQARFFAGDYATAVDASLRAEQLLWTSPSQVETEIARRHARFRDVPLAEFRFYGALSYAAAWDSASSDQRQHHFEALTAHHRQLEIWAEHCPENFENRAALVGAEIARIEGRVIDAEGLYERAIRSAHANGFIHNEADAYEVAARFYAARGFDKIADTYLREARYCYLRWGADGKVRQLDELHPHLRKGEPNRATSSTIIAAGEYLDLATIIKVSQAVSGEIVLENLIDKVMRAAIEHAGAVRGLLILPQSDELQIKAEVTTSGSDVTVHLRNDAVTATALPESVVRYAVRTREYVILDDAIAPNLFSADPYIIEHHARSIMCLPLVNQGRLNGIIYLENNLAAHVFTSDRITTLKVLASQAAMSLENTGLYRDLENREKKIRRLVDANVVGIVMWNLEGAITGANDAFLHMVGYDREDLASGRVRWTDLTPHEWRDQDERAIADLKANGVFQPFEKEYFRKDGSRVPILLGGAFFEDSGNEGVAFILDRSEQERAEAEIRALKDQMYKENLALRDEVEQATMFDEIVGTSNPLKAVLARIARVAPTNSTVLITGETGTGKELIARAIHRKSPRADRAFVSVNCAAIPHDLIPSELFGHEKGAFTGATRRRLGRFELADGGTIFLDEIGELLPDTQVALLRVLQERELERVGGGQPIHVDVRVIAATNRDLKAAVANGTFRQENRDRKSVV